VGAADQVELIDLEEIGDHVHAEEVADAALAVGPALHLLDGVGPEQVAEEAGLGDLGRPRDAQDLLDLVEVGAESAVHADDLVFNDSTDGHGVEALGEDFPHLDAVAPLTYVRATLHSS
jgi:hypothetical protein